MKKLYVYVDETGQDTLGKFFLVSIVISQRAVIDKLKKSLEKLEKSSGKKILKWTKTPLNRKIKYIEGLLKIPTLKKNIYYAVYHRTTDYELAVSHTIVWSVLEKTKHQPRQAKILIDGISEATARRVSKNLTQLGLRRKRIKSAHFRGEIIIRLADALAGFLRDYEEKQPYAIKIFRELSLANFIIKRP